MEPPAVIPQYLLPEEITVTRSLGAMVGGSVALHTQHVPTRFPGIPNCKIDSVGTRPDLLIHSQAPLPKGLRDCVFEVICFTAHWSGDCPGKLPPTLTILNEVPKGDCTTIVWVNSCQVMAPHARYENCLPSGAGNQDV